MDSNELLSKENLSTLFVWLYMLLAPYIATYISQEQFLVLGLIIVGVIGAVYSSKHPNTMFNKTEPINSEEPVNLEYECDDDGA